MPHPPRLNVAVANVRVCQAHSDPSGVRPQASLLDDALQVLDMGNVVNRRHRLAFEVLVIIDFFIAIRWLARLHNGLPHRTVNLALDDLVQELAEPVSVESKLAM